AVEELTRRGDASAQVERIAAKRGLLDEIEHVAGALGPEEPRARYGDDLHGVLAAAGSPLEDGANRGKVGRDVVVMDDDADGGPRAVRDLGRAVDVAPRERGRARDTDDDRSRSPSLPGGF